jgi:hypothetical protein
MSPGFPEAVTGVTVKEYGASAETGTMQRTRRERKTIVTKRKEFLGMVDGFGTIKKKTFHMYSSVHFRYILKRREFEYIIERQKTDGCTRSGSSV